MIKNPTHFRTTQIQRKFPKLEISEITNPQFPGEIEPDLWRRGRYPLFAAVLQGCLRRWHLHQTVRHCRRQRWHLCQNLSLFQLTHSLWKFERKPELHQVITQWWLSQQNHDMIIVKPRPKHQIMIIQVIGACKGISIFKSCRERTSAAEVSMSEAGLFSKCVMLVYDKTGLWRRVWWSWWLWQLCKCVMLIYESKRQDFIPAAMVNHQYQDKDQRYDQRLLALSTTLSNVHFPSKTQESCLVKTPKLLKDRFWMPCHSPDRNVWFHEPLPILWRHFDRFCLQQKPE